MYLDFLEAGPGKQMHSMSQSIAIKVRNLLTLTRVSISLNLALGLSRLEGERYSLANVSKVSVHNKVIGIVLKDIVCRTLRLGSTIGYEPSNVLDGCLQALEDDDVSVQLQVRFKVPTITVSLCVQAVSVSIALWYAYCWIKDDFQDG